MVPFDLSATLVCLFWRQLLATVSTYFSSRITKFFPVAETSLLKTSRQFLRSNENFRHENSVTNLSISEGTRITNELACSVSSSAPTQIGCFGPLRHSYFTYMYFTIYCIMCIGKEMAGSAWATTAFLYADCTPGTCTALLGALRATA